MDFTKLEVWTEARKLTNLVYSTSKKFPKEEQFGLTNQMRRSSVSIPSNIAEGCSKQSSKETIHFLYIAKGSLFELETQIYIALDQNYIIKEEFEDLNLQILTCKKLINGFINYYKKLNDGQ